MSRTTDFILEEMDRHQFDEVTQLQDHYRFIVVQNGTITMSALVKEEVDEKFQVLSTGEPTGR